MKSQIELAPGQAPAKPTGWFFCPNCRRGTLHEMTAGGWKKGPCLECGAEQLELFPEKMKPGY